MSERFGTKLEGRKYTERVGAYAVAFDEQGRVALLEAPVLRTGDPWLFLPGGGPAQMSAPITHSVSLRYKGLI